MSRIVILEAERHRHLRLDPLPRGGTSPLVVLGRSEIPLAVHDFPLFLAKDGGTGAFEIAALVGLVEPRNLYWSAEGWRATYLPELLLSAPFRLDADSPTGLSIDRDDARLGDIGEALFDASGEPSVALIRERRRLERIVADAADGRAMAVRLVEAGVVRPVSVALSFADGRTHDLTGLYSFDPAALAALDDPHVVTLFRAGDLAAATLMLASTGQLERLRQLHNMSAADPLAEIGIAQS